MTDISFTVDEQTYNDMKKMFSTYEDGCSFNSGIGTISKGTIGITSKDCFQIEFMQHRSESWFSNKPMNKIYIRKMECEK